MNQFTKDELKLIEETIAWHGSTPPSFMDDEEEDLIDKLHEKVKYMIKNYCEPESTENIGGWCFKCIKCGMKFGDEAQ